mmetsp:Transcript_47727/g.149650  ORF Transcript_47727/g.149650 Transcript_47727/m.149650 type:complete len:176 (-) Transcript_47727:417-944(-)
MACCDNRMPDVKTTDEIQVPRTYVSYELSRHVQGPFLITCFDESDTELRDIKIQPTTKWTEMQLCISEVLGAQAMFAYDDGTGVDFPVRNEEEWDHFLDILRNDKSVNGEVDSSSTRQPSYLLAPGSTTSCCSLQGDGRGLLPRNDPPVEMNVAGTTPSNKRTRSKEVESPPPER